MPDFAGFASVNKNSGQDFSGHLRGGSCMRGGRLVRGGTCIYILTGVRHFYLKLVSFDIWMYYCNNRDANHLL